MHRQVLNIELPFAEERGAVQFLAGKKLLHAETVRRIFTIFKTPFFCLRHQLTGSYFVFKNYSFASYLYLRKTFAVLKCNTFIAHVLCGFKNVKLYCSVNTDDTCCSRQLLLHHLLYTSFGTACTSHSQLGFGPSILSQTATTVVAAHGFLGCINYLV